MLGNQPATDKIISSIAITGNYPTRQLGGGSEGGVDV